MSSDRTFDYVDKNIYDLKRRALKMLKNNVYVTSDIFVSRSSSKILSPCIDFIFKLPFDLLSISKDTMLTLEYQLLSLHIRVVFIEMFLNVTNRSVYVRFRCAEYGPKSSFLMCQNHFQHGGLRCVKTAMQNL